MRWIFVTFLTLAFLGAAGLSVYLYLENQELKKDPQLMAQKEVEELVLEVGQFLVLPADETPTIATVTDPAKLQEQSFFMNAEVGDKVLLYTNAKKAILYRPSTQKIIEVAPINLGDDTQTFIPEDTTPPPEDVPAE
jgi:hypothetical protein